MWWRIPAFTLITVGVFSASCFGAFLIVGGALSIGFWDCLFTEGRLLIGARWSLAFGIILTAVLWLFKGDEIVQDIRK